MEMPMHAPISSLYAGILTFVLIALSIRVITLRRKLLVGIGSGEHPELARAIRAHANFTEYTPLALILLALAEIGGAHATLLHGAGLLLLTTRVIHAISISKSSGKSTGRVVGMMGTFAALAILAVVLIAQGIAGH